MEEKKSHQAPQPIKMRLTIFVDFGTSWIPIKTEGFMKELTMDENASSHTTSNRIWDEKCKKYPQPTTVFNGFVTL